MDPEMAAARAKLAAKFSGKTTTGGKGTVRRKHKAAHKSTTTDDKKMVTVLKKLGVTGIPSIEEVNMFKADGKVLHFNQPKVQASIPSNTYVVSGTGETKNLQELLPGIISQLGPDNLASLKAIAEQFAAAGGAAAGAAAEDDDDDVPELVESFEEASTK